MSKLDDTLQYAMAKVIGYPEMLDLYHDDEDDEAHDLIHRILEEAPKAKQQIKDLMLELIGTDAIELNPSGEDAKLQEELRQKVTDL